MFNETTRAGGDVSTLLKDSRERLTRLRLMVKPFLLSGKLIYPALGSGFALASFLYSKWLFTKESTICLNELGSLSFSSCTVSYASSSPFLFGAGIVLVFTLGTWVLQRVLLQEGSDPAMERETSDALEQWRKLSVVLLDPTMLEKRHQALQAWYRDHENLDIDVIQTLWNRDYATLTLPANPIHSGRPDLPRELVTTNCDDGKQDGGFIKALAKYGRFACSKSSLKKDNPGKSAWESAWKIHVYKLHTLSKKVKDWDSVCFAVSGLDFDSEGYVSRVRAKPCTYLRSVLSADTGFFRSAIQLAEHRNRAARYIGVPGAFAALYQGRQPSGGQPSTDAFPLLTVQGLVVYQNHQDPDAPWEICCMRRSKEGDAGRMWQLPPAGACEVYVPRPDSSHIQAEFNILRSLQREFLEEVFNDQSLENKDPKSRQAIRASGYRLNEGVRLTNALFQQPGSGNTPAGDAIHFLGAIVEPFTLRLALTYLIVIRSKTIQELKYATGLGDTQAQFQAGSPENDPETFENFPIEQVAHYLNKPDRIWHSTSVGALKLLADVTQDEHGWFRQSYPDFPVLRYT